MKRQRTQFKKDEEFFDDFDLDEFFEDSEENKNKRLYVAG